MQTKADTGMSVLRIRKDCLAGMIEDAMSNAPLEACGILAGRLGLVTKTYPMRNVDAMPEARYFMEPKEQLRVVKEIRAEGLQMLGIYHSHPSSPAYPSEADVELAFYPEAAYVIVSLATGEERQVRAFNVSGSALELPSAQHKIEEMALEIVDGG